MTAPLHTKSASANILSEFGDDNIGADAYPTRINTNRATQIDRTISSIFTVSIIGGERRSSAAQPKPSNGVPVAAKPKHR